MSLNRSLHYDLIRLFACLLVCLMHSPLPQEDDYGPILSGLSYVTAPCIGLFFMISGALLLKKNTSKPFVVRHFLTNRFSKIIWPTVIWSFIGLLLTKLGIHNTEKGILWFMYALSGLYLLTPVLYRWLSQASKREVEFYLFLWIISLTYPFLGIVFDLEQGVSSWIFYFQGYAGYFVLGSYLASYQPSRFIIIFYWVALVVFSFIAPLCVLFFHLEIDFYNYFWYLSISIMLQCVFWWKLFEKYSYLFERFRTTIESVSKLSFGIYLVHILIMCNVLWKMDWMKNMSCIPQIMICAILTLVISATLCWLISKWKYSKFIIGV